MIDILVQLLKIVVILTSSILRSRNALSILLINRIFALLYMSVSLIKLCVLEELSPVISSKRVNDLFLLLSLV